MWSTRWPPAAHVFSTLWVATMWRLRRTDRGRGARDRDLAFALAAEVSPMVGGVTSLAFLR